MKGDQLMATGDHHGHVVPRVDGTKARCGGPALCDRCAAEALLLGLPPPNGKGSSFRAVFDVTRERMRQVMVEGFTATRDDGYTNNELPRAAVAYAGYPSDHWPWPWPLSWWKPTTRRRDLVKAAALLIAEIERLDRLEARGS